MVKMTEQQQIIYDHLVDNPPVLITEDGTPKMIVSNPHSEAFWRGVRWPNRHFYPGTSSAYGAFKAGRDSRRVDIIQMTLTEMGQ